MWRVVFDKKAEKQFNGLDSQVKKRIAKFIDERLIPSSDPRDLGKPLVGKSFGNHIRFRIGDYRLICDIQDQEITVLVLRIGHRREIYRG
ncbi:type II toxin-antitoxin system RelE/ParE family toxin [Cysteiniphilum sp. QT6929]|uniref:type II toxin-antitoxin system RelE family toxin n=1 Tax=Cysteiniphilum sp. QT6929 TaxID=2975055 RepID=UPI0024B336D6|nr:type II toxin-antitoxin system RelE/ParE family toxin [Cysteiniphilum sp. QT6929]WHN65166.1 type II toxin-antitoxin system RelE/ParE family toxin [Cysteiniphilum sp. QT6929]